MKKSFAISAIVLYLFFTSGLRVHMHFCCGKLAEVQLSGFNEKCCETGGESEPAISKSCCTYTELALALDDVQRKVRLSDTITAGLVEVAIHPVLQAGSQGTNKSETDYAQCNPPPVELFKMHCSFVFYG